MHLWQLFRFFQVPFVSRNVIGWLDSLIGCTFLWLMAKENNTSHACGLWLVRFCLFLYLCLSRVFFCTNPGSLIIIKFTLSSYWLSRHPCLSPALGSSVALGFSYCSDLLCTLCQNSYTLHLDNFNFTKCLFVASTGIPGTVFLFGDFWFWFTGSSCDHLLLVHRYFD